MKEYRNCIDVEIWQAMKGGDPQAVCRMMEKFYQTLFCYGLKLSAGDETLTKETASKRYSSSCRTTGWASAM
jgi:hypothetical protein